MTSHFDPVAAAVAVVGEIVPTELQSRIAKDPHLVVIDCRETEEFATGTIPGASLIPRLLIPQAVAEAGLDFESAVVVYCTVGARSAIAAKTLHDLGYRNATSLAGGIKRWAQEGLPIDYPPSPLSAAQRERYARHLVLPEVGESGQEKLLGSKVALIGAGGLGSPVAMYLAAAGVGTLGLIDFDDVDVSNLQRQILHGHDRIGRPKVESARQTLEAINPDVEVIGHRVRLEAGNVLALLGGFDVIVDGADNFPTRYLVNDASLHLRKPVVHGSIFRFEGQVSVFDPYKGPCYRCLFPLPPPPELAPDCAEAGVLGVLPGIIGSIQAIEALKLLLGVGESLVGRLLVYDALEQTFDQVRLRRDPDCPACSDPGQPPVLHDYDSSCRPLVRSA
jgi:molybdopterin/thiamine biosynthesis adenylyltransferase/rhodanese-related sulfurtransferase